jgi:small subunit ribosomal protein S9
MNIEEKINYSSLVSLSNGTGKAKSAIARSSIKTGTGKILVNGKDYKDYFKSSLWIQKFLQPLKLAGIVDTVDITVNVSGGGISSQAYASARSVAIALSKCDLGFKILLKSYDLLSKSVRRVYPKKAGYRKSRKKEQFSKR